MTSLLFIFGLAFLIIGAEALVRGASRIASGMGIPPLIIGLTVVAFGTSSPELAVNIKGVVSGQADIALGNVLGSNIFNILFILGISALIIPLRVSQQLIRLDVPLMIGLSILLLLVSMDSAISRYDGLFLVTCLAVYLGFLIYMGVGNYKNDKEYQNGHGERIDKGKFKWLMNIILVAAGLVMLVAGSRWLVDSAVIFARYLGVSELIIGLTIVAAGTSLPEVVTSVIAAFRGERDIAVGNVVGSNIFNILAVLGLAGIIAPAGIEVTDAVIGFDIPVVITVAVACLPILFTGGTISRWEGALFVAYYGAYTLYLVLAATKHDTLPLFSNVMFYFIIPLTLVTVIVIALQEWRHKN